MIKLSKSSGYTLVEIVIVLAIMAILATIAFQFLYRFRMRAKASEAFVNLATIRSCEEAYRVENDNYKQCDATPATGGDDAVPDDWAGGGIDDFASIGFRPSGKVRFQYKVDLIEASASPDEKLGFSATATSDMDKDGSPAIYTVTNLNPRAQRSGDDY
jgi:prepilin-type N-terminal cleavage/methylation domain-containing protein